MTAQVVMTVASACAIAFMVRFLIALNREPRTECHLVHFARPQEYSAAANREIPIRRAYLRADLARPQSAVISGTHGAAREPVFITERRRA